jgi:hypothetical protein
MEIDWIDLLFDSSSTREHGVAVEPSKPRKVELKNPRQRQQQLVTAGYAVAQTC